MLRIPQVKFSTILCIIYILLGLPGYNNTSVLYIRIVLFGLWVFVVSNESTRNDVKTIKYFYTWFLIWFFLLCTLSSGISNAVKYGISYAINLSPILIISYYLYREDIKIITYIVLPFWNYMCIKAILFYSIYPHAARLLAMNKNYYGNIGIGGGYNLAYGGAIIVVLFIDLLMNRKNTDKKRTVFIIITLVLNMYLVFQTASTVTIIGMIVGISFLLLYKMSYNKTGIFGLLLGSLFILVLIILIFANWNRIGNYLVASSSGSNDIIQRRINEIGQSMSYGIEKQSDLGSRINSIISSLETFLNHPFFGAGNLYGYNFIDSLNYGIGSHGELTDILAIHGFVGGLPLIYCYLSMKNRNKKISGSLSISYFLTFLFLFIFNPFNTFQSNIAYFVIVPGLYRLHEESTQSYT